MIREPAYRQTGNPLLIEFYWETSRIKFFNIESFARSK